MKINANNYTEVTEILKEISSLASKKINEIYSDNIKEFRKKDNSPVTVADIESNRIIIDKLSKNFRNIKLISEESNERSLQGAEEFFIIAPLDGTKEFIKKNGEFTVNIALIENNKPILGVIYVPTKSTLYFAQQNFGSFKINITSELKSLDGAKKIFVSNQKIIQRVIGSRSHSNQDFDEWVKNNFPNSLIVQAGSSYKFCLIAEGSADIYPRFGPTSEWDIAAGHIIVDEAGGRVITFENNEINYNSKEDLLNPQFYAIGNYKL